MNRDALPVKRRAPIKKDSLKQKQSSNAVPEDVIEQEVHKRIQNLAQERLNQKLKLKGERIKKLSSQIV